MSLRALNGTWTESSPSRSARLEGRLGRTPRGEVSVGDCVVVLPAGVDLDSRVTFVLVDGDTRAVIASEGQTVRLRGGLATRPSEAEDSPSPELVFWIQGPIRVLAAER